MPTGESQLERIKILIRENDYPLFTDDEIDVYFEMNNGNINDTVYQLLLLKSENSTLQVSGLSMADSSSYFKRMAARYKPNNTGYLG